MDSNAGVISEKEYPCPWQRLWEEVPQPYLVAGLPSLFGMARFVRWIQAVYGDDASLSARQPGVIVVVLLYIRLISRYKGTQEALDLDIPSLGVSLYGVTYRFKAPGTHHFYRQLPDTRTI